MRGTYISGPGAQQPPRDGEDGGPPLLPPTPSFSCLVIYYFITYLFVFICCPLSAALPGLPAPGVYVREAF